LFGIRSRFTALICELGAGFGYLDAQVKHGLVDRAARGQITTAASGRQTAQAGQEQPDQLLHLAERFLLRDQFPFLLGNADANQLRFREGELRVSRRAWRLLPLAPQVSQVGNTALVEREAVTLPLDHAFGFEFSDVGPAAIEVQRQCRRADALTVAGFLDRGRETGLPTGGRPMVTVSAIVFVPVASR
jgi:hypothetical protein